MANIYTNANASTLDEEAGHHDDGNTTPSDVIYSASDVPLSYAEACRMRRSQSFRSVPHNRGADWPQFGQIRDLNRSDFSTFWCGICKSRTFNPLGANIEPKCTESDLKKSRICRI